MAKSIAFGSLLLYAALAAPVNQLQACSPLEIVIARGTSEPAIPYGVIVGDPLMAAVKKAVPVATGYAVNYPAGFAASSKTQGIDDIVKHMETQPKACPDQKYVLVGYSQGADVTRGAAIKLSPELFPRIVAIVMFGDPGNKGPGTPSPLGGTVPMLPKDLEQKLKENCASGDPVCSSGSNMMAHLTYVSGSYMADSASYVKKQFESGGRSGPGPLTTG